MKIHTEQSRSITATKRLSVDLCESIVCEYTRSIRHSTTNLNHLTWEQVQSAISNNKSLKVVIDMTGPKGDPICGSIRRRKPGMEGLNAKERDRADWEL